MSDRFFKIPVDRLAAKILDPHDPKSTVEFNESQLGMLNGLEENRFWVHISARRTGKSYAASILSLAKLLEPHQLVTIVAPNYNLSSIIWDYVTQFIKQLQIETDRFNAKDKVVQLINGSTFRLLSANNRDSLVGRAAHLLIVDEAAIIEEDEYFTRDLRPALSTYPNSRALFITTPRGKVNYMYSYYLRGQEGENKLSEWGSSIYDWTSNPKLKIEDIEEARSSMTESLFRQEYYCEWTVFEGQIYNINEDKHLTNKTIDPNDHKYDFIAGLDIGYRDATAFVVIATDGDNYYVVDEYIAKESVTSADAEEIQRLSEEWRIENIYIDSAAAQARADLAYEYDIYCENAIKSVNDGISHLQTLVEKNRLYFLESGGFATFKAMSGYRWNPKTDTQKPIHDDNSHASDAVRYAIYTYTKTSVGIYTA